MCGRYEGVDQRVIDAFVTDEVSVGDYVLSGGEVAAMAVIDSVARLVKGVIAEDSLAEESFSAGLLEYPHYTRPEVFRGMRVPEVLLSGHHENIRAGGWRRACGRRWPTAPISRPRPPSAGGAGAGAADRRGHGRSRTWMRYGRSRLSS